MSCDCCPDSHDKPFGTRTEGPFTTSDFEIPPADSSPDKVVAQEGDNDEGQPKTQDDEAPESDDGRFHGG